jgi:mevalonate kinase
MLTFEAAELGEPLRLSLPALAAVREELLARYRGFAAGEMPITEVLPDPRLLAPFAWSLFADEATLSSDLRIAMHTDIPVGCGMGSSAAVGLSQLLAASCALDRAVPEATLQELGLACERLLHGQPSGVDTTICRLGGVLRVDGGQTAPVNAPPGPLYFVNTGRPASSTGEAVSYVRQEVGDSPVWLVFHATVGRLEDSLRRGDRAVFREAVRTNHELLCQIGVTPPRVQRFIAAVERAGGAAKVCGAGAVKGDAGGMVLVAAAAAPTELAAEYGYTIIELETDRDGLTLL